MSRIQMVFVTAGIVVFGICRILYEMQKCVKAKSFAEKFFEHLRLYADSRGQDAKAYTWLIGNSARMQGELGYLGIVADYRLPASNDHIRNYQVILNMLPELRRSFSASSLGLGSLSNEYFALLQETLIRYTGVLETRYAENVGRLRNPLIWFREGVKGILLLPLDFLGTMGLANRNVINRFSDSAIFRVGVGLVAVVGFLSSLVTIVIGWEAFIKALQRLL